MDAATKACRDYAHWAGEIDRLSEEIRNLACPMEDDGDFETGFPGSPSCFRAASEETVPGIFDDDQGYARPRSLDEIAPLVRDCPECSRLVVLIRQRKHARQRWGVAKRAVRRAGKATPEPEGGSRG